MNAKYVNAFLLSTKKLFDSMLHIPIIVCPARLREAGERPNKLFKISAGISISGTVSGNVWLSFSEQVALAMASALAQQAFAELDDDCRDALGEIGNMIVGAAKTDLAEGGVAISLPKLLATSDIEYQPHVPTILIPIDTSAGRFVIEAQLFQACKLQRAIPA